MSTRRFIRAAWLAGIAVAATASTAHAAPLTASFDQDPAAPQPGQVVTFTSTTSGGGTAPIRLAWDLDDDGQFDDGTAQQVTSAFTAGDHVVRLRARQVGAAVFEDVEAKTIHVAVPPPPAEPTPDPTPVPTPDATPEPTPPPAATPGPNQPPSAVIDDVCMVLRRDMPAVCTAPLTTVGKPKTFKATKSSDADGQIVRHEWDLDGDGSFEQDTGTAPEATRTYENEDPVTVRLRVTDDKGATSETSLGLRLLEPACSTQVLVRRLQIASPCMKRTRKDGVTTYTSTFPVSLNGIVVAPKPGKLVSVRLRDVLVPQADGRVRKLQKFELLSFGAEASIQVEHQRVVLDRGLIHLKTSGDRLTGIDLPDGQTFNGLDVTGMEPAVELPSIGTARPALWLRLPAQMGAPSSEKPVPVTVRHEGPFLPPGVKAVASAGEPLSFSVPSASIGSVGLKRLVVTYDGVDYWGISAAVSIPSPLAAEISGDAGIRAGKFDHAGVDATFPDGLGPIGPGVYLTRIAFRVEIKPKMGTKCMPTSYGTPALALCGEVGLSAGPRVAGVSALGIAGGLGFATYDDKPSVFRAWGEAKLVAITLASADIEVHTNGYLKASASYQWGIPGWVNLSGGLGLEMLGSKFNASGRVEACLQFVDWCERATGLVSTKGIAACLHVDLWLDTWEPGFGYRWNGDFTPYFSGCDVGAYKERLNASAAQAGGARSVTLPAGLPGAAFAVEGAGGPPVVTLIGPNGERIETPRDHRAVETERALILPNPKARLTQIAVVKPAAGRWQVVVEDGSSPVTSLKVAEGLPEPEVSARVVRRGGGYAIRYSVTERPGQTVAFSERGASAGAVLGTAKGAKGELRFTPADGKAESRRIVAVVTQDGQLRDEVDVATYRAPAPRGAGTVRGLRVSRKGGALRVRWTPAARARQHAVAVTFASGRRVVSLVKGRAFTVRGVARGERARVAVHGVTASGIAGKAAVKRLR